MRLLEPLELHEYRQALAWMELNGWAGAEWYRERLAENDREHKRRAGLRTERSATRTEEQKP